ncbi:MAG: 3-deoxy-D-manno-octulosonic acid transferase [Roseovarius sp.]
MQGAPLPVRLYRASANLIAPLAYRQVRAKLGAHGISGQRLRERQGHATVARPEGRLLWFHAASVGESLSVLRLIEAMGAQLPDTSFLITSGTATSAEVLARRLPPRTQHQFAPLDAHRYLRRFLAHWRPDAAVFVESELWPQMLMETRATGAPLALVNARLSEGSARNWRRFGATARFLLGHFALIHCQDRRTESHFHALGLAQAQAGVNLKSLAGPLPVDSSELAEFRASVGERPLWLAASTHPGEEEIVLDAHRTVLDTHAEALLLLVPRHPERAGGVAKLVEEAGLTCARRSEGAAITPETQVYLADTLGEMGLWYAAAPITCLCGSFTPVGGHNPFEPAQAGTALLHGPLYANFEETYPEMAKAGAAREAPDAARLARHILHLLEKPEDLARLQEAGHAFALAREDALGDIAGDLSKALGLG